MRLTCFAIVCALSLYACDVQRCFIRSSEQVGAAGNGDGICRGCSSDSVEKSRVSCKIWKLLSQLTDPGIFWLLWSDHVVLLYVRCDALSSKLSKSIVSISCVQLVYRFSRTLGIYYDKLFKEFWALMLREFLALSTVGDGNAMAWPYSNAWLQNVVSEIFFCLLLLVLALHTADCSNIVNDIGAHMIYTIVQDQSNMHC